MGRSNIAVPSIYKEVHALGDFNGMEIDGEFPQNLTVKKLDINVTDFTSWTWQQLLLATPNVEEIDILAFDNFIELPQLVRNVKVLKKLKIINVVINAGKFFIMSTEFDKKHFRLKL